MVSETYGLMREAVRAEDLETLAKMDSTEIYTQYLDGKGCEQLAQELGEAVSYVRHVLYTAWFWGVTSRRGDKVEIPKIVKDNLRWKPPVDNDPLAGTYGII